MSPEGSRGKLPRDRPSPIDTLPVGDGERRLHRIFVRALLNYFELNPRSDDRLGFALLRQEQVRQGVEAEVSPTLSLR